MPSLILHPDLLTANLLCFVLEEAGHVVVLLQSPRQLLPMLEGQEIELVLLALALSCGSQKVRRLSWGALSECLRCEEDERTTDGEEDLIHSLAEECGCGERLRGGLGF